MTTSFPRRVVLAAAAVALIVGCQGQQPAPPAPPTTTTEPHAEHEHHDHGAGPHGGIIADWGGGKYHVEFTVDHEKQEATVFILGDDQKTPVPIAAKDDQLLLTISQPPFQVDLKAAPQAGDPAGTSSRFVGTHEELGKEHDFAGSIIGEVDGTPYAGDFKEEAHAADEPKD